MIRGFSIMPGVPALGHVVSGGYWHPGSKDTCPKCDGASTSNRAGGS